MYEDKSVCVAVDLVNKVTLVFYYVRVTYKFILIDVFSDRS